ncbi:MAG: hypothetical protein ABIN69_06975 [Aestuariivirga sp.]
MIANKITNDRFSLVNKNAQSTSNILTRCTTIRKCFKTEASDAQTFDKLEGNFIAAPDLRDIGVKFAEISLRSGTKD